MKRTTETVTVQLCPPCVKFCRSQGLNIHQHKESFPVKEPRSAGVCWNCNRKRTVVPYDITYNVSR